MTIADRCTLIAVSSITIVSFTLPLAGLASTTTCGTVAACVMATNSSGGPGIEGVSASGFGASGVSKSGHGLHGESTSSFGVVGITKQNATSTSTARAAVLGQDESSNKNHYNSGIAGVSSFAVGVSGISASWLGVSGTSSSSHGVDGRSATSFGAVGATTMNSTGVGNARAGVVGEDNSTNGNHYNSGVAGTTSYGIGVLGQTTNGTGVLGQSKNQVGVNGGSINSSGVQGTSNGGWGVFGNSQGSYGVAGFSTSADGVAGFSNDSGGLGLGVRAQSAGNWGLATFLTNKSSRGAALDADDYGAPGSVAILAIGRNGGNVFVGSNGNRDVASIDNAGNLILSGSVTTEGAPLFATRSASNREVTTYGERASVPTLDDAGEGLLVNGSAYVRLDPVFAATIDPAAKYLIFITTEGDSRGVYTTQASRSGFAVRENSGGRSSVPFAYRIVARPLDGKTLVRLPATENTTRRVPTDASELPAPVVDPSPIAIPVIPKVH